MEDCSKKPVASVSEKPVAFVSCLLTPAEPEEVRSTEQRIIIILSEQVSLDPVW